MNPKYRCYFFKRLSIKINHFIFREPLAIFQNALELVGKTPIVRINKMTSEEHASVYVKLESFNPGGSIKDRIALNMILDAERKQILAPGDTIIEPTSGNTGIGLAIVAAVKGYRMILTMPDTMSFERRSILELLGAKIFLTPGQFGMSGAVEEARRMSQEEGCFMPSQFMNPANPLVHEQTTAQEILEDFTEISLDCFVAGVGTGGTISGTSRILKKHWPHLRTIAVEPSNSPVLSGGEPGFHGIQGIGAGFIPETYDKNIVDEIIPVQDEDAIRTARQVASTEGLLIGISAGASLYVALTCAKKIEKSKNILAIIPDGITTYMMTSLLRGEYV